ncbi:MAG: oligosaccharide flippase family protein [Lachnospiraceae bacterium]|nr:oligosaccharide flippase family protein [Lachnospiraceae bacterium]
MNTENSQNRILTGWKKLPVPSRSALIFGICSFLSSGISFLLMPLFTRLMDTEQYGIVTDYNSWHYILEVFAVLGLASVGSFNVGLNEYRENRNRFVSNMLIMVNLSTFVVFGLIFIFKATVSENLILPWPLLILMGVSFIFSPATTFFLARKRYEYGYIKGAIVSIGSMLATQGISIIVLLIGFFAEPSTMKIAGSVAGILIFAIPLYIYLLMKGGAKPDRKMMGQMFTFTLPLLPHYLALHAMNGADRIMVGKLASTSSEAIYGVSSAVGLAAATVWTAINGSLQPYVFEKMNEKDHVPIKRTCTLLIAGYGVLCVLISLMAPEILMILAPSDYKDGLSAIPPIVGMAFLNALYNVYASIEFYHKKSVGIAAATIIAAALNIVLNAWLIPIYGLSAAAYTTLIANGVLTFCHYIGYRRCSGEKIFNDLAFLGMSVACIGLSLAVEMIYDLGIVRYVSVALIVIISLFVIRRIKIFKK